MKNYAKYKISIVGHAPLEFIGRYVRELETNNWHYYERDDGIVIHIKKDGSMIVTGDTIENIKANRK